MCLITNQQEPTIATEDISVWKLVNEYSYGIYAWIQPYQYKPNELNQVNFSFEETNMPWLPFDSDAGEVNNTVWGHDYRFSGIQKRKHNLQSIAGGFHSCKKHRLEDRRLSDTEAMLEFIIPKGAEYYQDVIGDYVSNQIILKTI